MRSEDIVLSENRILCLSIGLLHNLNLSSYFRNLTDASATGDKEIDIVHDTDQAQDSHIEDFVGPKKQTPVSYVNRLNKKTRPQDKQRSESHGRDYRKPS